MNDLSLTAGRNAQRPWEARWSRWLLERQQQQLLRSTRCVEPLPGGRCRINQRELWNFGTNDYLGLSDHPLVIDAARQTLSRAGVGARASALVCGHTPWHVQLEQALAAFEGTEKALVFPSGWAANTGILTALIDHHDIVFCDRWNHASLIDGCRASGATLRIYRHDHLEVLERELRRAHTAPCRWIVTDAVFSMDGDLAPLDRLADLAQQHTAGLIVDEAHGTGVYGMQGRGACEHYHVEEHVTVRIGTLSKALGTLGGFVCGSHLLIETLVNAARSLIYSTALPPAICAAAITAIQLLQQPQLRRELWDRVQTFQRALTDHGLVIPKPAIGPIIPIILGDAQSALWAAQKLEQRGFLVPAIRPPAVAHHTARLRISVSRHHPPEILRALATTLYEVLQELNITRQQTVS
ncbi:MAG: 8-amino-7-oxononanoate synthase [Planctomycetaceae bacterium]|nr:MAG: 8-amino-7-oxononanoate synthase [Planctomycetaceae bacterium]